MIRYLDPLGQETGSVNSACGPRGTIAAKPSRFQDPGQGGRRSLNRKCRLPLMGFQVIGVPLKGNLGLF